MASDIGIVGLGLIGGSVGLALRDPSRTVVGFDPDPEAARTARDRMCVDALASLEEVARSGVVFVAVPPDVTVATISQVMELAGPETVVTDCASVKSEVAAWAATNKVGRFVPGHPMAGHEKGGATYASAWMFRGARWILTPTRATANAAVRTVEALVKAMGAQPSRIDASAHDRHVATVSHLPHALAAVLVGMDETVEATNGSWRDMTRVGGVDPELWTQILMRNRKELAAVIAEFEGSLNQMREALERDDREALRAMLERARKIKEAQNPPETGTRTVKRGRR